MKRNCIVRLMAVLLVLMTAGCAENEEHAGEHREDRLSDAVQGLTGPVNETILASSSVVYADSGSRIFETPWQGRISYDARQRSSLSSRVAGRIERMHVRYNYQPVKKGQLIMEVYSPDLVAAQRELLFLDREKQTELKRSAVQKLQYLGMTQGQIDRVLASGEPLYRVGVYSPASGFIAERMMQGSADLNSQALQLREGQYVAAGDAVLNIYRNESVVAEFSLTSEQALGVHAGQPVLFQGMGKKQDVFRAKISLIEPLVRNGESFSIVRVYLPGDMFSIGELVEVSVPVVIRQGWWLPESAVVDLGNESAVFVRSGEVFSPKRVATARKLDGYVQVMTDLEGQAVARDAAYLVDSESFINLR